MKICDKYAMIDEIPEWSKLGRIVLTTHHIYQHFTMKRGTISGTEILYENMWKEYFCGVIFDEAHLVLGAKSENL